MPGITAAQGAAGQARRPAHRPQARRGALQYITGHARDGALPDDIDWQSLADPAATTAVYMPAKTLAALVARALAEGLDAATPALAIARATRPDQQSIAAPIADLPARLQEAALPGPVLVMIGGVCAASRRSNLARENSARVVAQRHRDRDQRAGDFRRRRRQRLRARQPRQGVAVEQARPGRAQHVRMMHAAAGGRR